MAHKARVRTRYKVLAVFVLIAAILVLAGWYLHRTNIPVLEPRGPIAQQERQLIIICSLLSLIVVIPLFTLFFVFSWRYRVGNTRARAKYSPDFDHSRIAETIWWLIPTVLIGIIAVITWRTSYQLDPFKPLASDNPPLNVQVVAEDWKWLFIYPDQHIATVNMVQFPKNTPVNFEITSDSVMNSFWIPQLGGQIYAMPGMTTQLHLMASQNGSFTGSSANISGAGFAGMHFTAKSSSVADFNHWVQTVSHSSHALTPAAYADLVKPSRPKHVSYYSSPAQDLYDTIVLKYMTPAAGSTASQSESTNMNMMMPMAGMDMQ